MSDIEIYDSSVLQYYHTCNRLSEWATAIINANAVSFSNTKNHAHHLLVVEDNVRHVLITQDLGDIIHHCGLMQ